MNRFALKTALLLTGFLPALAQTAYAAPRPARPASTVPHAAALQVAPVLSCAWAADIKPLWKHVYNAKTDRSLPLHPTGNGVQDDLPTLNTDLGWINRHGGGVLTSAAGATLSDTSKHWDASWKANSPLYVAITSGAALGQMRAVVSHTGDAVTLDSPWSASATPAPGDQYCVTSWVLKDTVIKKNTFWNNPYALTLFSGGVNITIADNTSINSEGIFLGAIDYGARHFPLWNTTTTGNKISNPNGLRVSYIYVVATIPDKSASPRHANLTWHNTVTGNTLLPHPAGAKPTHSPDGTGRDGVFLRTDGWGGDPRTIRDTISTYTIQN